MEESSRVNSRSPLHHPVGTGTNCSYFDHDADVGIVGRGSTIEAAFVAAAEALFALIADPAEIGDSRSVRVSFDESDLGFALVTWLNDLLAEARAENLALCKFELARWGDHWEGAGHGDTWRPELEHGIEVKGATFTELVVRAVRDEWEARCVVDV